MFDVFERYMKKMIPGFTTEEVKRLCSSCVIKKWGRKEILLHEGEICRYKIFVTKGLLRNYSLGENGNEYIVRFTDEGGWTTEPESFYTGQPSAYYIAAIERSEVMMWSRDDFEALKETLPALATFSENIITANVGFTQRRLLLNISASAEEKYIDFINTYPGIFQRVPLHMVASYLGVSRETLTRIRQELVTAGI